MFKDILESVNGIEIYAIAGLILFFAMFITIIIWMYRADKSYIEKMKMLPLENNHKNNFNSQVK